LAREQAWPRDQAGDGSRIIKDGPYERITTIASTVSKCRSINSVSIAILLGLQLIQDVVRENLESYDPNRWLPKCTSCAIAMLQLATGDFILELIELS